MLVEELVTQMDQRQRTTVTPALCATIENITPEIAAQWLAPQHKYLDQRPLNQSHVERLSIAMEAGEFEQTDSIKLYELDGREYLIDGQHRLSGLIMWGGSLSMVVVRRKVTSAGELKAAFGRLDRGKPRMQIDIIRGSGVHLQAGLGLEQANLAANAYKVIAAGFAPHTKMTGILCKDGDFIIRGLLDWQDEARRFFRCTEGGIAGHRSQLQRNVIMALAMVTLRYQPEVAEQFWQRLAVRDKLEVKTGEWHLAEELNRIHQSTRETKKKLERGFSKRAATAWNAHYHNRQVNFITVRNPDGPIKIDGTIYKGDCIHRVTD